NDGPGRRGGLARRLFTVPARSALQVLDHVRSSVAPNDAPVRDDGADLRPGSRARAAELVCRPHPYSRGDRAAVPHLADEELLRQRAAVPRGSRLARRTIEAARAR